MKVLPWFLALRPRLVVVLGEGEATEHIGKGEGFFVGCCFYHHYPYCRRRRLRRRLIFVVVVVVAVVLCRR